MAERGEFLSEMQALISERREEIARIERRIAASQEAREAVLRDVDAIERAIELYRAHYHLPPPELGGRTDLGEELRKHAPKDMIIEYAKLRSGRLRVREASQILASTGAFKDARNAASNIYAAIDRNPGLFEKVRRGEYQLVCPSSAITPLNESEPLALAHAARDQELMGEIVESSGRRLAAVPPITIDVADSDELPFD